MPLKRVPLTGSYNTRPGTGVLSGSACIVGIAIVGVCVVGQTNSGSSKDTRYINCLPITEVDEIAQSKKLYVVDRPGFAASLTPAAGSIGNAIHVWVGQSSKVMSCFGATNSTLYDSTTSKGAITGKATGITETSISGTATLAISSTDSTGWYYDVATGTVTKIADVDFPGNASRTLAGTFAHLDGYPFIMDSTGRVYNGDLNSITAWTAASYITANSIPDVGIGAVRHRNTIVAFCREHFDVFRNAGNPSGSPLSRVEELSQRIGCIGADAICDVRDTIYFAGSTKGSNIAIYSYNGGQVQKVSVPEIEDKLVIAGPSSVTMTALGFYGRHFLVVSAGLGTYVHCIEEKSWHEWTGTQLWYKADGVSSTTIVNYAISKSSTGGKVYVLNPASIVYADDGSTYTALLQTSKLDFGTQRRKTWKRTHVISDQPPSSVNLSIAWQDDDYQTQSVPRTVDLSSSHPNISRCGNSRRRSFLLSHTAAAVRLEALELEFDVGNL